MGTDLRYSLINTFAAIDAFRNNIIFNLQGAVTPGFNIKNTNLNQFSSLNTYREAEAGTNTYGTVAQISAGPSELRLGPSTFRFQQGVITPSAQQNTNLAINGNGFFAVTDSLQPGSRVLLTREGDFTWGDTTPSTKIGKFKQFHLETQQGLFVLRIQDIDLNPNSKTFMTVKTSSPPPGIMVNSDQQRDATATGSGANLIPGKVRGVIGFTGDPASMTASEKRDPRNNNSDIAILRVPLQEFLQESSFGSTVYETNVATRPGIVGKSYSQWVKSGDPIQVLSQSLEIPASESILNEFQSASDLANFVYKNLTNMLDNYNKSLDDLLGLVK